MYVTAFSINYTHRLHKSVGYEIKLTGSEVLDSDCNTVNSDVVISGKCGTGVTGVTVLYKAEDKVIGKFTGDVNALQGNPHKCSGLCL